jgi:hypothetical protein
VNITPTLKTLATAVGSFAPTLATMLLGPLAGTAVAALESAFGLKQGAGPDAITQLLQTGAATPDQINAAHAADLKHAEILGQQGVDLAKINADHAQAFAQIDASDRSDARAMQTKLHSPWPGILSALTTVALVGAIWARFAGVQLGQDPITANMIGTLQTGWMACLMYWVGSTRQSANNQNALAAIAKNGNSPSA